MTQPTSTAALGRLRHEELPPPSLPVYPPCADPPEPPLLPDVDAEVYAKAIRVLGAVPHDIQLVGAMHRAQDARVQQRLDTFRSQATPTYHTRWGDFRVAAPFVMGGREIPADQRRVLAELAPRVGLRDADIVRLQVGRAGPEEVRRITQALIDADYLAPPAEARFTGARIREMMYAYGIGFDCVGYVAQAFAASRGVDREQSHLGRQPAETEQLSNLASRGFLRVGIDVTRPGDIIVLGKPQYEPVGHRVIVYAARDATDEDRQELRDAINESIPPLPEAERQKQLGHAYHASLRVLVVDSSWGNASKAQDGGVERKMWWHDTHNGQWSWTDRHGNLHRTPLPYDHPIEGSYRPGNE